MNLLGREKPNDGERNGIFGNNTIQEKEAGPGYASAAPGNAPVVNKSLLFGAQQLAYFLDDLVIVVRPE
jgi:hypothetical protein